MLIRALSLAEDIIIQSYVLVEFNGQYGILKARHYEHYTSTIEIESPENPSIGQ